MKHIRYTSSTLIFITLTIMLLGCATKGPKFTPLVYNDESKPLIYLYRDRFYDGIDSPVTVYIDEQPRFNLNATTYMPFVLDPGHHGISIYRGNRHLAGLPFNFEPGKTYYLQFKTQLDREKSVSILIRIYKYSLVKHNEKDGLPLISKTTLMTGNENLTQDTLLEITKILGK